MTSLQVLYCSYAFLTHTISIEQFALRGLYRSKFRLLNDQSNKQKTDMQLIDMLGKTIWSINYHYIESITSLNWEARYKSRGMYTISKEHLDNLLLLAEHMSK